MKAAFIIAALMTPAMAAAVTPVAAGSVGGSPTAINAGTGDQNEPHVSGDIAAYTDSSTGQTQIHYYDFAGPTPNDHIVTAGPDDADTLSDVSGNLISFSRFNGSSYSTLVFDVSTTNITTVATSSQQLTGSTIGGTTVGWVDTSTGSGDVMVRNLSASGTFNVSASSQVDGSPQLSPSGDAIVWETQNAGTGFDIMKASRVGGVWGPAQVVTNLPGDEGNPATDGVTIVYDAERGAAGQDIYYQPLSGGAEAQLQLEGSQRNPSIASGVIAFESLPVGGAAADADLYLYVIATNTLWQITNTPGIGEHLNDVTVLSDGRVRVVWAADEPAGGGSHDIWSNTFSIPLGSSGGGTGGGAGGGGGGTGGSGGGDSDDDGCEPHHDNGNHNGWGKHGHQDNGKHLGWYKCRPHHGGPQADDGDDDDDDDDGDDDDQGNGSGHLSSEPTPQTGCSAAGGLAPMLFALIALALLMRRPVPVRVRRK